MSMQMHPQLHQVNKSVIYHYSILFISILVLFINILLLLIIMLVLFRNMLVIIRNFYKHAGIYKYADVIYN